MSTLDVSSRRRPAGSFLKRGSALLRAAGAAAETGKEVDATKLAAELAAIKPMKIKEIKAELEERGVDWKDLLEKEEFMHRLASARVQGITKPSPSVEETNEEAASTVGGDQSQTQSANSSSSSSSFSSSSSSSSSTTYSEGKEKGGGKTKVAKVDEATRHSEVLAEVMKLKVSNSRSVRLLREQGGRETLFVPYRWPHLLHPRFYGIATHSDIRNQEGAGPPQDTSLQFLREARVRGGSSAGPSQPALHH